MRLAGQLQPSRPAFGARPSLTGWAGACLCAALLGACSQGSEDRLDVEERRAEAPPPAPNAAPEAPSAPPPSPPIRPPIRPLVGEAIARAEWAKADNRSSCAPLALAADRGGRGTPRRATFSGGWAVAFDRPDLRSAYGFAGVGALPDDKLDFAEQVDRLARQWPNVRRWDAGENLPAGSIAGYGLEGARPYREDNPSGVGEQSGAYLRIPGQSCLYNVWSRLGRDHLQAMLADLSLLETGE